MGVGGGLAELDEGVQFASWRRMNGRNIGVSGRRSLRGVVNF